MSFVSPTVGASEKLPSLLRSRSRRTHSVNAPFMDWDRMLVTF